MRSSDEIPGPLLPPAEERAFTALQSVRGKNTQGLSDVYHIHVC